MEAEKWDRPKILLFCAALVLAFYLIYRIHIAHPYPLHVDEWQHIALAKCTIEERGICQVNPYFKDQPILLNLEGGFHVMLSLLSIVGGLNLILDYRILPALFGCISALILFAAVRSKTGSFLAGFFSIVFMASVKSNINILGFLFFTPLALAIPLVYTLFYTIPVGVSLARKEFILVSTFIAAGLAVIHPPSALVLIPATALYLMIKHKSILEHRRFFVTLTIAIVLASALLFLAVWEHRIKPQYVQSRGLSGLNDLELLSKLVTFSKEVRHIDIKYDLRQLYGTPQSLLAILGLAFAIWKRRWFMALWPVTTLAWLYSTSLNETQTLIYYQRMVYYALISLVPLTGVGAAQAVGFIERILKSRKLEHGLPRAIALVAVAIILTTILAQSFRDYSQMHAQAPLYDIMDKNEYEMLTDLESRYGADNVVYTDKWTSVIAYPVSGNKVVHMVTANLWGRDEEDLDTAFNKMPCDEKKELALKHNVNFILTTGRLNCTFLNLEDDRGGDYLYRVME